MIASADPTTAIPVHGFREKSPRETDGPAFRLFFFLSSLTGISTIFPFGLLRKNDCGGVPPYRSVYWSAPRLRRPRPELLLVSRCRRRARFFFFSYATRKRFRVERVLGKFYERHAPFDWKFNLNHSERARSTVGIPRRFLRKLFEK